MEIPRHWRLKKQRYALIGEVCPHCDAKLFPPRDICPQCKNGVKTPFQFSGKGEIYSVTSLHELPAGFEEFGHLTIALVRLNIDSEDNSEKGPLITAQITDLAPGETVEIGQKVEMVTRLLYDEPGHDGDRKKGIRVYGYKFRPDDLE